MEIKTKYDIGDISYEEYSLAPRKCEIIKRLIDGTDNTK